VPKNHHLLGSQRPPTAERLFFPFVGRFMSYSHTSLMADEHVVKGQGAAGWAGAFLSFTLKGLMGFIAAAGALMALGAFVASRIGEAAVLLIALGLGSVVAVGFLSAWLAWLTGPSIVKTATLIIKTTQWAVVSSVKPNSPQTADRNQDASGVAHLPSTFRRTLTTSCWKAGRWAIALTLLWACSIAGAAVGVSRHRYLVDLTRVQSDSVIDALTEYKQLHGRYPARLGNLPNGVPQPYLGSGYNYQCVDSGEWCQLQYTVDPWTCFEWTSDAGNWTEIPIMLLPVY
jgi:hypothetical protein